ncbi:hypothetical protein NDN08_002452 [Rhodosorus marinus]|uniref:Uncharacterized protein n=1 Tax=Rhodosorus marinus TaxID=101924 RepID=A0AAV8UZI9_9RHOD|nr:hypothetical protein NDN08_002452 [Rhodosorus marinus]
MIVGRIFRARGDVVWSGGSFRHVHTEWAGRAGRLVGYITREDRKELLRLHFSNPEKYSPDYLAEISHCPVPNIRGMIKLAYVEKAIRSCVERPYLWNIVKKSDTKDGEDKLSAVPDTGTEKSEKSSDDIVEAEEVGAGERQAAKNTSMAKKVKIEAVEDGGKAKEAPKEEDEFMYTEFSRLEKLLVGKLHTIPEGIAEVERAFEALKQPPPFVPKPRTELTQAMDPNYAFHNPLEGETERGEIKKVAPTLFRKLERQRTVAGLKRGAEKILEMSVNSDILLQEPKPMLRKPAKIVFMDISEGVKAENADVWTYDLEKKKSRKSTERERERMVLFQMKSFRPKEL